MPPSVETRKRRLELTIWAAILSLSFYPGYFGFVAWFALVRPFMIISQLDSRQAFRSAYFFAFCANAFSLYWVGLVTPPGAFSAIAIVAFYLTAILMIFNKLYRLKPIYGTFALPFLWTGLEYFRTLSEFAFPWSDIGYSQSYYLYILQIVSVISVHGLSFLIIAVNVMLWQLLRKEVDLAHKVTCGLLPIGVIALLIAYGWAVMPINPLEGKHPVTILQGSVPIEVKWADGNEDHSFRLYDSLARQESAAGSELYVWPETSAPSYLSHDVRARRKVGQTARATGGVHLVGALGAEQIGEQVRHHNSAYLFDSTGAMLDRYDKVKLVPFTEQVPYQDNLPFLRKEFLTKYLTFIETYGVQFWSDFRPGDSAKLYEAAGNLFAPLICYEVTFPEYVRKTILDGADYIVEITNDTWFGHSLGIHMHSQAFVTRAVENRCWGVRAANSGLSYIVDGYGRIRYELPLDQTAALSGSVNLLDGFSIFTRYGDLAGLVSLLITLGLAAILVYLWIVARFYKTRKPD
jgi:apolipoprotein N-acyltransferase